MPEEVPFDLRGLEVFLAVCDAGGMSAAARLLGLTQPAVSQAIGELETRSGATLFDRGVRPLSLTAAGLILRQRASALLAEARQIAPLLRQTHDGRLTLVRVGLVDSLSRAVTDALAGHLARVAEQASFFSGLTAAHTSALLTRQIDVFLGADEAAEVEGVERWPLFDDPYILLCPATMTPPTDLAELAALAGHMPLIRFSARSRTGREIEQHLRRLRIEFPRFQEYDLPYGLTTAVASGQGFAISTPLCLFESAVPAGRVRAARLPGPALTRRLTLIARRKELGRLPRELAATARAALAGQAVPFLRAEMPWLGTRLGVVADETPE
ncbi:MAG TPA: LysR family transcriptional regulator [Acetobacteraceae bacterium]|nr:LysR family transcriptional regulator [Acetobacteraceae bacterium]